ncbi:F-box protein [Endozoicomonas sp. ONNA2]|uniref:F-box protein n=1 Tax=Endozoicomonas sp. ONNA2 TaxID=2828741 RepID=UPI002149894E|nr:F-box protein [Endozoicomonas sp. ONNA2]
MNNNICTNAIALTHPHRGINPSDNHTKENTAQGISVVSPQEVSPLLALPNEILVKIADGLTSSDLRSLNLTSRRLHTVFNTEEHLKILANDITALLLQSIEE